MITFMHETPRTRQNGLTVNRPRDDHKMREIKQTKSEIQM
jgi:hypothetical protein